MAGYNATMNQPPPPSLLLSWLRLLRAPNVFTALADIAAGFALAGGLASIRDQPLALALLLVGSGLLYLAGMVLNDVADVKVDTEERPFRPLPSGRISLATATRTGWTMLLLGVVVSSFAGFWTGGPYPARSCVVAVLLAGAIVLYNFAAKRTLVGPVVMGSCRVLNWLLGMSIVAHVERTIQTPTYQLWEGFKLQLPSEAVTYPLDCWLAALGIGVYVAGITIFAKGEAAVSRRGPLILGTIVMAAGIALIAMLSQVRLFPQSFSGMYPLLLAVIGGPIALRAVRAITDPQPEVVQATVKSALMSLIVLDAAACLAGGDPKTAFVVALLLLPMLGLGRWVYST